MLPAEDGQGIFLHSRFPSPSLYHTLPTDCLLVVQSLHFLIDQSVAALRSQTGLPRPEPHRIGRMGCVQAKPGSMDDLSAKGLDKLKQEYGYRARGGPGYMGSRRSTSQRQLQADPRGRRRPPVSRGKECGGGGSDSGGGGGGGAGKLGGAEVERAGNGSSGNVFGRPSQGDEEETVEGWPKWLVNNVPRRFLEGLVPKSADSYRKIDKVMKSVDIV